MHIASRIKTFPNKFFSKAIDFQNNLVDLRLKEKEGSDKDLTKLLETPV